MSVVGLALLFGALAFGTASAREGLRVVGHDEGPQVVASASLYLSLSDMDAQVADVLLMGNGYDAQRAAALKRYEQRRAEVGDTLLRARGLAEGDAPAIRTITSVLAGLGRYERLAAQALLLNEQAGHQPGPPPRAVLDRYREASDVMQKVLLPQAYNLTLENATTVRHTHERERTSIRVTVVAVVVIGAGAVGCLVWLQVYLARRFRRVFGPALLVATALTALSALSGAAVLNGQATTLDTAKRDGFDSVLVLARARAIANSMHADQSRFLLDPERADTYQHTYLDKSQALMYVDAPNLGAYQDKVAGTSRYLGLLGTELAERPSPEVVTAYQGFQQADRAMRALPAVAAVAERMGGVRTGFEGYDTSLVRLSDGHRAVYTRAVADGDGALDGLWRVLPFGIVAIGAAVVAGVRPRLKEYR
ncbi:hypothetical protein [Nonomuraea sp. NPDC046570]|uniref:hypothetical protein n=1 Tax=Nonomuraea sp. NPDC046570 TaxID=3155255 RepID=UPI0033D72E70